MKPVLIFKNKVINEAEVKWSQFGFDDTSCNEPTVFELYFRPGDEYEYKYAIKILPQKINEGSLYCRKTVSSGKRVMIFERDADCIRLGTCLKMLQSIQKSTTRCRIFRFCILTISWSLLPMLSAGSRNALCVITQTR